MEARLFRPLAVSAALVVFMGAGYRTPNFIVETQDPRLAEQIGKAAEKYRRELAISWTGRAMPDWAQPCTMTVHVGPHLGAGGATTFLFDRGEVYGWRMNIQGSAERVLDSVLPHEITHMIFASHFRCPLPRWADEGGATSVEHAAELAKHHKMLTQFLRTGRGIAFNHMFAMTEYPADVMPLYAQGFALAEYLIMQGGRRKYLDYLTEALQTRQWSAATQHHYGYRDLGALQNAWLGWVAQGFPALAPKSPEAKPPVQLASSGGKLRRPEPNLIYRTRGKAQESVAAGEMVPVVRPDRVTQPARATVAATTTSVASPADDPAPQPMPASGWRAAGSRPSPATIASSAPPAAVPAQPSQAAEPVRTQVTHPQPIEHPRQMILEWNRTN